MSDGNGVDSGDADNDIIVVTVLWCNLQIDNIITICSFGSVSVY